MPSTLEVYTQNVKSYSGTVRGDEFLCIFRALKGHLNAEPISSMEGSERHFLKQLWRCFRRVLGERHGLSRALGLGRIHKACAHNPARHKHAYK